MSFVIFHKDTTRYLRIYRNRYWQDANFYATEAGAKAALTRAANKAMTVPSGRVSTGDSDIADYRILPMVEFLKIEKTETKTNLLSGKQFTQSVNTASCCDPSTETYHSM